MDASLKNGGIPDLKFERRKQIRSLLILEDSFARPLAYNPISRELSEAMTRRGVPVLYGRFAGSPDKFKTADGSTYLLEDYEDQRRGLLVLVFTDGKSMSGMKNAFALESLATWPMVAWMELEEKSYRNKSAILPASYNIPIFPATASGVLDAVKGFLTEQGSSFSKDRGSSGYANASDTCTGGRLDALIEQTMGDALLWACDCAMIRPISPGLADSLRRNFHPQMERAGERNIVKVE